MNDYDPLFTEIAESAIAFREFRVRKKYRNQGILYLIFFLLAGIGSAYGMWIDAPPDRRLYGAVFMLILFSFLSIASLWMILAYKYESLTIQHKTIIHQGMILKKAIDLSNVKQVHWKLGNKGGITLKSLTDNISINLDNFEHDEQLWLIRYFQSTLPESVQQNWNLFCSKIALPLRDHNPDKIPTPGPDELLITRKRWAKILVPIILVTTILGLIVAWQLQSPRFLLAPATSIMISLIFCCMVPKQGFVVRSDKHDRQLVHFLSWWFTVGTIVFFIFKLTEFPEPQNTIAVYCSLFVWTVVYLVQLHRSSQAILQRDLENAKVAVHKWKEEKDCEPTSI
ncbi:hypothetical protein [Gimesia aquarii]|uniref:Uncharacterized protein n=1 Tax=Gimesia aquarii TaxID=2527964 RepID=A0A517VUY9_9PLAN|nr:hypothetical protein [Gimesia aquarii]QDT96822.1 hypothetical protein V144x_22800 [Gimesia aquarii]